MSDLGSIVVIGFFILLTSLCVIAVKSLLGVSFLVACLVAGPAAFVIGMLVIWLLGKAGNKRQ